MAFDEFDEFLSNHKSLYPEVTESRSTERLFPIKMPPAPQGALAIPNAFLVIPKDFHLSDKARIQVSEKLVLLIPHVESNGYLCLKGDPGPLSGLTPQDRIDELLCQFYCDWLNGWYSGKLDGDFEAEALNYWNIHVKHNTSPKDPIWRVYTVDKRKSSPQVYNAILLAPYRILVVGKNLELATQFKNVFNGAQEQQVLVAEVPIDFPLTPITWPKSEKRIDFLLKSRLSPCDYKLFSLSNHRKKKHKVVILRAPQYSFGFLLPGGPVSVVKMGHSVKSYPSNQMKPLKVDRVDPSWICGRDQHSEVAQRQKNQVVVLGVGSLGSSVVDQLARAGVGKITLLDPDVMSPENLGRHVLGVDSLGKNKAVELKKRISKIMPNCNINVVDNMSAEQWLKQTSLTGVDLLLDLTGEPDVRLHIELKRKIYPCPVLIAWMEPYVAAAHACILPVGIPWIKNNHDRMEELQAVDWPDDVIQQVPGCSSQFQSYTSAAAVHAVALASESAINFLDGKLVDPIIRSWVRGQRFLDTNYVGLHLKKWAEAAEAHDGLIIERDWNAC